MFSIILSFILVVVGALNWLCIGFFQYDFVAGIFGSQANIFSRIVYIVVGLSAIWLTYAVIRYKATLQTMAKKVNKDMDSGMKKVHKKTVAMNTEASNEILGDNSSNEKVNHSMENLEPKIEDDSNITLSSRNTKYESGRYNDFGDYYTSSGYNFRNSRRTHRDFYDEDEDSDDDID